jgi:hypothetical protein
MTKRKTRGSCDEVLTVLLVDILRESNVIMSDDDALKEADRFFCCQTFESKGVPKKKNQRQQQGCTGVSTRLHCMRVEKVFMNNEAVDLMINSL